jgi:hypothetical protein
MQGGDVHLGRRDCVQAEQRAIERGKRQTEELGEHIQRVGKSLEALGFPKEEAYSDLVRNAVMSSTSILGGLKNVTIEPGPHGPVFNKMIKPYGSTKDLHNGQGTEND